MSMYCPECGSSAGERQKFCRSCGTDLRPVAQIFLGLQVIDLWKQPTAIRGLSICVGGAAVAALLALMGKVGYSLPGDFTTYTVTIAVLTAVAGAGLLIHSMLPKSSNAPSSPRTDMPRPAERTGKIQLGGLSKSVGTISGRAGELQEASLPRTPSYTTAPQGEQVE